jgi:hypothetical protein
MMGFTNISAGFILFRDQIIRGFFVMLLSLIIFNEPVPAQSTDQNLPTPVSTNQLSGEIKARDIGDSRLTTYFYVFNGNRGDIFVNVVTNNLNGDIDIFTSEGLRPQTKITIYADASDSETGRVIYLRKPEKLILRIQGRSPNDDPATFQIKFAGSFEPITAIAETDTPELPEVKSTAQGPVRVNSVGTIIEATPKPTPVALPETPETEANAEVDAVDPVAEPDPTEENPTAETDTDTETAEVKKTEPEAKISPVFDPTKKVEDILKEASADKIPPVMKTDKTGDVPETPVAETDEPKEVTVGITEKTAETSAVVTIERVAEDETVEIADQPVETEETETVDPLANIFLRVELKDGRKFERPMNEVLSMNVIKGILTIVTNDGKIQEFSILDVLKMTIE